MLDPETVTYFFNAEYIPWLLKPIYGVIADFFPMFGYKRRSWAIVCCLGTGVGTLGRFMFRSSFSGLVCPHLMKKILFSFANNFFLCVFFFFFFNFKKKLI